MAFIQEKSQQTLKIPLSGLQNYSGTLNIKH